MKRSSGLRLLACLVALTFGLPGCSDPERDLPNPIRNVVLISIDALGALHSSAYGYERKTTPTLDRVAVGGTLFLNAYTQQVWTPTSHLTMMTGLYPQAHGASHQRAAVDGAATLAEVLRAAGFETAAFTGAAGYMSPDYGLGRGFQHYEAGRSHLPGGGASRRMQWLGAQARARESDPDHRFFMFVHSYDVHSDVGTDVPYDSPPDYRDRFAPKGESWERRGDTQLLKMMQTAGDVTEKDKRFLSSLYDGGVLFTDHHVLAPLIEKLQAEGLWDETLVVITADHGEELFEHGFTTHQQPYEETARVPLVFAGPGIPKGLRVTQLVELVDLMPTVLSLLALPIPVHTQGQDLGPLLRGEEIEKDTVFVDGLMGAVPFSFARHPSNATAEIDGERWSYIAQVDPGALGAIEFQIVGDEELYRLSQDPRQLRNVIGQHPEIAAELRSRLLTWYASNRALQLELFAAAGGEAGAGSADPGPPILSEGEVEALKALGYAQDEAP